MRRGWQVAWLVALSVVLAGSRCEEAEGVSLEELRQDVAPVFDYGLYWEEPGGVKGGRAEVLLVHRAEHLERVYADAQGGEARARALFERLEGQVEASGRVLAAQATSLVCTSHPACTVQWKYLEEVIPSRGEGGTRLRRVMAESFEREAKYRGVRDSIIIAALSVLMVGMVVEKAEASAAAAGGQKGARERGLAGGALAQGLSVEETAALEARLAEEEALEGGARHPAKLEVLRKYRPVVGEPPGGVTESNARWVDYVAYWEERYEELAARKRAPDAVGVKPPLTWEGYAAFIGRFQRALEFQRQVARTMRAEAGLAREERRLLGGMEAPLVEENVGLAHGERAALTYVDQLVVDKASLGAGKTPRVHSLSNKQRDFMSLSEEVAVKQFKADVLEASKKYGGTVQVRRPGHPLFGRDVTVSRVHLVYDAKGVPPVTRKLLGQLAKELDIELHFHE
jgi:hypothetical protein